ncbi:MAG: glycosyltransferase family 4 protein [Gemmatimonadaceae bacterium]
MRVLLHYADTHWTGRARFLAESARSLVERGARVVISCRPDSVPEQRFGVLADVTVRTVDDDSGWLDESSRLRRVLRDQFSEVVVVHTAREHLVAAAALRLAERGAVLRRVPIGATPRGGRAERTAAFLATSGFVVSSEEELQSLALPRRPLPPMAVPPGVDVETHDAVQATPHAALGVPSSSRLLVCAMDATARPRVATVLRTLALLAERHPDLRLLLIGSDADHEDLRMHAAALGIIHRVAFLGEREDHLGVLKAADIGWVVAEHDAAAYGMMDFMALGVAMVAERDPIAARYVADGITGSLLPPADAPASAAVIATLLADDQARKVMGAAGRLRVGRDFGIAAMSDALEAAVAVAGDRTRWRRT